MNEQASVEFAKKYIADLLSFFGVNADIAVEVRDGEVIEISVGATADSSLLIGRGAETLRSLQYIVATTLRNNGAAISRVNLDISDYKKQHADKVAKQARVWIEEVIETGDTKVLDLNAADRRVVHHVADEYPTVRTFSEGEGRERRLIIAQQSS